MGELFYWKARLLETWKIACCYQTLDFIESGPLDPPFPPPPGLFSFSFSCMCVCTCADRHFPTTVTPNNAEFQIF